jgi:hypothetical protein
VEAASLPGGAAEGVSWERVSRRLPGDALSSWTPSADPDGATPGRPNSTLGDLDIAPPAPGLLAVHPSPFRVRADGAALVVLRPGRPTGSCRIAVYDSYGERVSDLSPWAVGDEHRAVWNGRDASNRLAPLGLYLIVAEAPGMRALRRTLAVAP